MDGSLGSYLRQKIGRFFVIFFITFLRAIFLGICLALFWAASISCSGYCLANRSSFNSDNLWSLWFFLVQILTILNDKENGIDFDVALGWHDDGSRY